MFEFLVGGGASAAKGLRGSKGYSPNPQCQPRVEHIYVDFIEFCANSLDFSYLVSVLTYLPYPRSSSDRRGLSYLYLARSDPLFRYRRSPACLTLARQGVNITPPFLLTKLL